MPRRHSSDPYGKARRRRERNARLALETFNRMRPLYVDHPTRLRADVAHELGISQPELSRRLKLARELEENCDADESTRKWELHRQAIHAMWNLKGARPTKNDFDPDTLKHRDQTRYQRWQEGSIDPAGLHRPFPRAEAFEDFATLLEQVAHERA